MNIRHRNLIAMALLVVGSFQMLGYLLDTPLLRGVGIASGVAPFPKVFCESDGYEPFAATFMIAGIDANGAVQQIELTAERYAALAGPYNRRNVYGATLAYAPRLPDDLRKTLLARVLAPGAPLRSELAIPEDWTALRIHIKARQGETTPSWEYEL